MVVILDPKRVIIAAFDGIELWDELCMKVKVLADGPIAPYLAAIKLNDALDGFNGADTFEYLRMDTGLSDEVGIFADLKLRDVVATNLNRIGWYACAQPTAIVTVAMDCSLKTWQQVPKKYPELQTALMGVPTDISVEECLARFGGTPWEVTDRQLGFICKHWEDDSGNDQPPRAPQPPCVIAGVDVIEPVLAKYPGIKPITPGIRDEWMKDKGSQERVTGTYDALKRGARFLVMGTQIVKGYTSQNDPDSNVSAEDSQEMTAAEIERYLADAV